MLRTAEIVAVGSELLTPERTDTNSLWLTGKLNEIGVEVKLKTIVGDDEMRLEEVIRDAFERSDIVITTGGLGPTEDDITRQVSARALNRELVFHETLVDSLRERFRRWSREMPEINKRQAYVIDGAETLPNPNGSAVGMLLEQGEKFLVALPGPPRELQPMFENHVMPRLAEHAGKRRARRRLLRVAGMGESALDEIIAPIYKAYTNVETSILFNRSEIEVHLTARQDSAIAADALLNELTDKIADALGSTLFAKNGETMEEIIGRMLVEQNKTLAVAESCTGGLIAMRLTESAGASRYFKEGVVAYSYESKTRVLGVPAETIQEHGAVSAETAERMAAGIRDASGADFAVSVTGIAGPEGGTEAKPVGTVFFGYADANKVKSSKLLLPGDRYLVRWRASQAALDYLRKQILRLERHTEAHAEVSTM
ncbi:MAG: competence/damage-inducible protein A [Acidobacteria bacterium]|nr:competence/damage-inducible protein A [Acidobacteriota bacterium]